MTRALLLLSLAGAAYADAPNDPRTIVHVPHEAPCPAIAKPSGDPKLLAAPGLLVDPDGFLRADIGIPEAVALLGTPVLCDHEATSGFTNMFLMPNDANAHVITLETEDDRLIGIIVDFATPVSVDVAKLRKKYGASKLLPAPLDSHEAAGATFSPKHATFSAQLMYSHRSSRDPDTAWKVHQIIFRRTAFADELPEGFHTQADVDRLIALALRKPPPDTVDFFGTLGVFDTKDGDHISFGEALPIRNVAKAAMEKRTRGGRDFVHAVTVTFGKPIAIDKPAEHKGVTRTIVNGKLTAISIVRDEP